MITIKSSDNYSWPWSDKGDDAESVFAHNYPAIYNHLNASRIAAINRSDQGRFWWELRSCSYWSEFGGDKIVWPDITNKPRFSIDRGGLHLGNTAYFIPGGDYYLLGILSAWPTWYYISKTAQPLRLRSERWQYRLFSQSMEHIPIPAAEPADRDAVASLAERCSSLAAERYRIEDQVRHRLTTGFLGTGAGKLNEKAQEWWRLDLMALGDALKTSFGRKLNPFTAPRAADEWEPYLAEKRKEVDALRRQLTDAEAEINDRVYKLFRLEPDEVALLKREVAH